MELIANAKKELVPPNVNNNNGRYGTDFIILLNLLVEFKKITLAYGDTFIMPWTTIMDIYFLRRFLDKDYITNVVAYTGMAHSVDYIYMLITYFDFRMTHCAYLNSNKSINELVTTVDIPFDLQKYFIPKERIQCTDLSNFPENFE
jgi:purine-cytosine permease-like protein